MNVDTMKRLIALFILCFAVCNNSQAAQWVKLSDNNIEKIMLDKQSILQQDKYKRAWVKVEYKTPQKNPETIDKQYNLSKLLWFFDCSAQKSATSQVFQYLNSELVYSAGIDSKSAEFIEPVPETDMDIAMRYVCQAEKPTVVAVESKATVSKTTPETQKGTTKPEAPAKTAAEKPTDTKTAAVTAKSATIKPANIKKGDNKTHWAYEGKEGPENWAKLSPEFATCDAGRNQSPINIDDSIHAAIKPLKAIQKFPAKDILNNGHTVQINFKEGNMLALDNAAFQMKHVHFHAPSENTIHGKSFPLEAQFVHADAKGNLAVIGVMFTEGKANPALAKLWEQLPEVEGEPIALKTRVIPSEFMPDNKSYYRFSGSLTTPPCSEGVRWLLMKNPITASKEQIDAFKKAVHHSNNRPIQALNGRVIIE
ncbi:surface-adhesin E family protein [Methylotenera versatilis]|uniref:carbonic anhydrase n=1 Tax=Methylotenera versatilis (strain 301) TaxID=666681 RepID=D7DKN1_METV0|nr:surface-adhesin E family protein [Methylotenera versatilis]ADI30477.1 Carbonate dehydratase [Methylotenera versatilis 301]